MTRAVSFGAGLPGPGQTVFPETAKESGRVLGLTGTAQVYRNGGALDAGGAPTSGWAPYGSPVRARIDPIAAAGGRGRASTAADQIDEGSTHVISLDGNVNVRNQDRIQTEGRMWAVLALSIRTDPEILRVEVKEV